MVEIRGRLKGSSEELPVIRSYHLTPEARANIDGIARSFRQAA
jgi:hypothetical protein